MKRRALILLLSLTALLVAVWMLPAREWLIQSTDWAQAHPRIAWAGFVVAYILAAVFMVPGSILTLAAGVLFGVALGVALVSLAATLGACCAFLVGRFLARDWVESRLEAMPRFRALDRAVARRGWLIVLLARLSVVIPYNLLNYALGLTNVSFGAYLFGTVVGMLPAIFLYVYLGSVAGSLASLEQTGAPMIPQPLFITGLVVTALLIFLIARLTARALRSELDRDGS
ncbi:MAG: TVP38/TMEM64 family protein [Gammaproteobacteria bacterium]|nr:TVP38/TMEM64 family protein [Chromatiales bacterium]MYA30910.1 TVP38/TMEM64 family protein [Gammaproteobacteria bacterium]MYE48866.1 TVP38/TMEM64 family protein [Gammaproteobacteria bacterium]MYF67745.1 TVP38/TMEM64 family protein [Gammaproteobacteria bacterium]MYK37972.1 TVP38/TMEM64 family protein [Gammaproteobacteria bacterium]